MGILISNHCETCKYYEWLGMYNPMCATCPDCTYSKDDHSHYEEKRG